MSYIFRKTRYRTAAEMCDAVATAWLDDDQLAPIALADSTDMDLARDVIREWSLDRGPDGLHGLVSWLDERGCEPGDIAEAFGRLRARIASQRPRIREPLQLAR